MEQQILSTGPAPVVLVETVAGDLHVMGWEQPEVLARTRSDRVLALDQQEGAVTLRCDADCVVRVPLDASLQVQHVSGDTRIKLLRGALTIGQVSGDLGLQGVGPAAIDTVSGDLTVRSVSGDLAAKTVNGDFSARDVDGALSVAAHGDVKLNNIGGDVSASANGDISAALPLDKGQYRLTANGDIALRVPADASARVNIVSHAQHIRVRVPGVSNAAGKGELQVILGSGQAEATLNANGSIALMSDVSEPQPDDFAAQPDDFGARFGAQFGVEMARMGEMIGKRSQEMAERIARHAEAKAQASAQRAARKAQRMAERMSREAERQAGLWAKSGRSVRFDASFTPPPPPGAPRAPSQGQPVTDEERLAVLRMVEQKKITVEQAEQLLAALEGRRS